MRPEFWLYLDAEVLVLPPVFLPQLASWEYPSPLYCLIFCTCSQALYWELRNARNAQSDPFVKGLGVALNELLSPPEAAALTQIKQAGLQLFAPERGGSYAVWRARPLDPVLVT